MRQQIEAVQRMQDFIAQHYGKTVTLADLARVAQYSPWQAHRLFAQHTGLTPAAYLRRLRLAKAALTLRDQPCQVTDVAFQAGFGSVDGFQRAFRREFGRNPAEFAKNPEPVGLFTPYGVKFKYVERKPVVDNLRSVFITVTTKPARKAIIKRGQQATDYFAYCEEVPCEVWGWLTSVKQALAEPAGFWLGPAYRQPATSEYVQGVEVALDWEGELPDGFDTIELPAATYLMFQGEPFNEEDYCQAIEELQAAINRYDPALIGFVWDQHEPRLQLEPLGARGYIELWPVRRSVSRLPV